MSVNVHVLYYLCLEDPLENEMFHLRGLSSTIKFLIKGMKLETQNKKNIDGEQSILDQDTGQT